MEELIEDVCADAAWHSFLAAVYNFISAPVLASALLLCCLFAC